MMETRLKQITSKINQENLQMKAGAASRGGPAGRGGHRGSGRRGRDL
eukprot:gene1285-1958_t